jgi:hypothetical protein
MSELSSALWDVFRALVFACGCFALYILFFERRERR